ncbi:MAG: enoyl-CoA hydratase/isomerase family protein [Lachnospiraceae bacterium]|nr:enoyl-CoA hydratase/isomerase family protein [Lachnospiraceae bacterium]
MSIASIEVKNNICTVTISRPPVNATDEMSYREIADTFHALDKRDDIKVIILTGAGKVFMAGNDLDEFDRFAEPDSCISYYETILNSYMAVKNSRYPVIGAINGSAAGAGIAFAGCCDVVVAARDAKFILSEIKVGIIGADGFASLLIPEKVLRYMAFSGNALSADEVSRYGGIWKVVEKDEVLVEANRLAAEFTENARGALVRWKQTLNRNFNYSLEEKFNNDLIATISYQGSHDFKEASLAWKEKRKPQFDDR